MTLNLDDFQKQDIKFDIAKLQQAYKDIVKTHKFEDAGVTNFGAISLTQIPGDPESIKGNFARGVFWTKPDGSGKEKIRDKSRDQLTKSLIGIGIDAMMSERGLKEEKIGKSALRKSLGIINIVGRQKSIWR